MSIEPTFTCYLTQFLRPFGDRSRQSTDLPKSSEADYLDMLAHKCELHAEVLTTGQVSITVSNGEEDIDGSLTSNGPEVPAGLIAMLKRRAWLWKEEEERS